MPWDLSWISLDLSRISDLGIKSPTEPNPGQIGTRSDLSRIFDLSIKSLTTPNPGQIRGNRNFQDVPGLSWIRREAGSIPILD